MIRFWLVLIDPKYLVAGLRHRSVLKMLGARASCVHIGRGWDRDRVSADETSLHTTPNDFGTGLECGSSLGSVAAACPDKAGP